MKDFTGTFVGTGVLCLTNHTTDQTEKITTDFEITIVKIYDNNYNIDALINKDLTLESYHSNAFLRKSDLTLTFSVGTKTQITDGEITVKIKQDGVGTVDFSRYENCGFIVFNLSTQGKYTVDDVVDTTYAISTVTKLKRKKLL